MSHTQLAPVADLFRNRSVAVDHFGAPSHAVQPLRLVNVVLPDFQAPTSSTNTAARLSGSIPLQHRIVYELSKHDESTLHLAAESLVAVDARQAAGAVLAEVFRHKPQFQTLADLEFAFKPSNYQHLNLTGLPASQSCQASPAGYINSKLQMSGQATQTDSRQRRTDHSLKTELMSNYQGISSIDLITAKDGRLIFADVAFINDSMAAAAWTYKAAPLLPLSTKEGARGHLHIKKSAAEVCPPWSKEQAQVKATSTLFVGKTSPQCADLVADRAMDLYNTFGANSPEVNSWEVTGCTGTKPKSASDVLLQTTGVRNVYGLLAMHTVTFADGMSISFHPVAGGVKREQDKFSFVVHGVSAAADVGRTAQLLEQQANCQLATPVDPTATSKLVVLGNPAKLSRYRALKGAAADAKDLLKILSLSGRFAVDNALLSISTHEMSVVGRSDAADPNQQEAVSKAINLRRTYSQVCRESQPRTAAAPYGMEQLQHMLAQNLRAVQAGFSTVADNISTATESLAHGISHGTATIQLQQTAMFDKVTEVADQHDMTTKAVTMISDYACHMDGKLDKVVADVTTVKRLATEQQSSSVTLRAAMKRMEAKLLMQQHDQVACSTSLQEKQTQCRVCRSC